MNKYEGDFRYSGLKKEAWYSICSKHCGQIDKNCSQCMVGEYVNIVSNKIDLVFYKICPSLWVKWKNRKSSSVKKRLQEIFPNLNK